MVSLHKWWVTYHRLEDSRKFLDKVWVLLFSLDIMIKGCKMQHESLLSVPLVKITVPLATFAK